MKCQIVLFTLSLLWNCAVSETCVTPLGASSTCKSLYDCKTLLSAFEQRPLRNDVVSFLRQSQCGFEGYVPRVCCGPLPSQKPTTTAAPQTTKPTLIFGGAVDPVSSEDSLPAPSGQCGKDSNGDRIYGGQFTDLGEFPWMALLGYLTKENKMSYQCGGVLINKRYVLTAAHCTVGEIENAVGKLQSARLGEYDIQTDVDCIDGECADPHQEIAVMAAYPHPGFVDGKVNREDDIALVRLAQRVKYTDFVQPICLVDTSLRLDAGTDVFVAGWGKTLLGTRSPVKLKLGMPIFNKSDCLKKYNKVGAMLTDKQICAGGAFAEDACRAKVFFPLTFILFEAICTGIYGKIVYEAEFSEDFKSCKGFENKNIKCDSFKLGVVGGNEEEYSNLGVNGELEMLRSVENGYSINLEVWKLLDIGKEFSFASVGDICKSIKNEDAPWYPLIQSMNVSDCPIPAKTYSISDLLISLEFAKDLLCLEFCGEYEVLFSVLDEKEEQLSCYVLGISITEVETDD
ncbi:unnamed protein product, partial [Iphiclides podalirius]